MDSYSIELGKYLTTRRLFLHVKVKDIVSSIGYNRISYYYFENGIHSYPLLILPTICNYLKINIDDALFLSDKPGEFKENKEIISSVVSNNIRKIRKDNKLTQKELSEKLSINCKTLYGYEAAKIPSVIFIKKFCDFFNVLPSKVFY